jgi:hypothetical protein
MATNSENETTTTEETTTHVPEPKSEQEQQKPADIKKEQKSTNDKKQQKLSADCPHEIKRLAINNCIKRLNEFTNSLNEMCRRTNSLACSLQSLENVAEPEVIGKSLFLRVPKKIFDAAEHLKEVTQTLYE